MSLYKPSEKASSDPIDFWYVPETAAPPNADERPPHVNHPAMIADVLKDPQNDPMMNASFKKPERKRTKERLMVPDEPSTGMLCKVQLLVRRLQFTDSYY